MNRVKFLLVVSIISCLGLFCYTFINLNERTIVVEVAIARPPEVSREDLWQTEFRLRDEIRKERLESLKANLQELNRVMKDQEAYKDFLKERLTALETRLTDYEALRGQITEFDVLLKQFAVELKSQKNLALPERFAHDLSFVVNLHVFAALDKPTSDGRGSMRIETKDGISGWVSEIDGEPVIFAAAHIPKTNLAGDVVCLFGDGRRSTMVKLFAWSSGLDCALFKFKPGYKYEGGYAELGDSDELARLSPVSVLGSPEALSQDTHFMASYGYVMDPKFKSKYSGPQPCVIMHWAICNSGNSGGPLFDRYGRVIGMNVMTMNSSTWTMSEENKIRDLKFRSSVYAATPINDIKRLLPKLLRSGEVKHGWVSGLEIKQSSTISPTDFQRLGIPQPLENLPVITKVSQASGGYKAGIKIGDVLISVNGVKVLDEADFQREIMHMDPGETAKIVVGREGKEVELFAQTSTFFWSPPAPMPLVIKPPEKK